MGFYQKESNIGNLPMWLHLLETFKLNDFLGLNIDLSLLNDIEIPTEGFDFLMDIIELTGYSKDAIKLINKNIPKDYDLSNFPQELLGEMLEDTTYHIVYGHRDNSIKIWNPETGRYIRTLNGHSDIVTSICSSHDGKTIASGSRDNSIKLWDSINRKCIHTLNGHADLVRCISFSKDSTKIISGSRDHTIKIWNIEIGQCINTLIETSRRYHFSITRRTYTYHALIMPI